MPLSTTISSVTSPVLCTDEDIAVRASADFVTLVPPWQIDAAGTDGWFDAGSPWTLNSIAVNFETQGVVPGQVVQLTRPLAIYPGGGHLLAIDSVSGTSVVLRRLHKDLNVGQPPAAIGGQTGVAFTVPTLIPQIEEASFDIKRRFGIDETNAGRSSSWVFDLRDLRQATVLTVLLDRYIQGQLTATGVFTLKIDRMRQLLDDLLARVQIRWGPSGNSQEPSTLFGCKLSR